MAQPNVSREPSMEEILASIRRIIESNEPVAADSYDSSYGYENESDELDVGHGHDGFGGVAAAMDLPTPANQSGPSTRSRVSEVQTDIATAPAKTVSLADLAARVRATTERADSANDVMPTAEARETSIPTSSIFSTERNSAMRDAPMQQARIADIHHLDALDENRRHMDAMDQVQPLRPEEPVSMADDEPRGLLSMQAGAEVARSFEELAAAVDGHQRRSLDEIAQDMLRPMLQDWLDDNLPTLVERLVREEIERIARGPRR
jgi:uncharacterized protein